MNWIWVWFMFLCFLVSDDDLKQILFKAKEIKNFTNVLFIITCNNT